jgi:malate synthase
MKVLREEMEDGLESLMGEVVTIFACRWIYTGKLIGVSEKAVKLEDPSKVFETGPFNTAEWERAEKLPHKHFFVDRGAIESFGVLK